MDKKVDFKLVFQGSEADVLRKVRATFGVTPKVRNLRELPAKLFQLDPKEVGPEFRGNLTAFKRECREAMAAVEIPAELLPPVTVIDGVPRIRDVDLAEQLGMSIDEVRAMIKRALESGELTADEVLTLPAPTAPGGEA